MKEQKLSEMGRAQMFKKGVRMMATGGWLAALFGFITILIPILAIVTLPLAVLCLIGSTVGLILMIAAPFKKDQ